MGAWYNIEMNDYTFNEIIFALEEQAKWSKDIYQISETVHLIDYLEEAKAEDITLQNKQYNEWVVVQRMFEEKKKPDNPFLYSAIQECLNNTVIKDWDAESQYHLVMNLIKIFDKYKEKKGS